MQIAAGEGAWGTKGAYLTRDGRPIYLNGANYIVSDGWMINLPGLSRDSADADLAALQALGVNHIRFFPMWQLTQPTIDKVDAKVMRQLDMVIACARDHGISVQIAPLTGWMSGAVFLPPWAVGDLFRNPKIIAGEEFLCRTVATRYKNNPAVLGYDFGNETNVLAGFFAQDSTRREIFRWMKQIYPAFREASPDKLITNGIGTGYAGNFDIRDIAQTTDYLAPHSYPYFHGTTRLDPWYGQRNSYSPNFIIAWCKMMGKPVVLQEFGCSEGWLPVSKIGANLRLTYISVWADGAAGFLWWGSHDIDTAFRVKSKDMLLQDSAPCFARGEFDEQEYHTGLLTTGNAAKEYALDYAQCIKTVNALGFSWSDELPVCYIVVPGGISFNEAMHKFITAYALAKQAHFSVKLCYEGTAIPDDAQAVFIPGLKLTGRARDVIQAYLNGGGSVYQSYENDFGPAITAGPDVIVMNPSLTVKRRVGLMEIHQPMNIPGKIRFREVSCAEPAMALVSFSPQGGESSGISGPDRCVFLCQRIGKGTFYYLAANLEADLAESYDPWPQTNAELFYAALKPNAGFDVDNKMVEFYLKRSGGRRILLLLNHSEQYQNVTIRSEHSMDLTNCETKGEIGAGKEVCLLLKPAAVVIANVGGDASAIIEK